MKTAKSVATWAVISALWAMEAAVCGMPFIHTFVGLLGAGSCRIALNK